jgi:hypothetical protein
MSLSGRRSVRSKSSQPSPFVTGIVEELTHSGCAVSVEIVGYEFQRGGNQMLRIRRNRADG